MSNVFSSIVRLGSDPSLRYTPSGKPVLSFTAASTIGFGEKQTVLWLRCTVWNNPEKIKDYLAKGGQVFVSGQLSQSEYKANDGATKTSLDLNVSVLDFVGKKQDNQPTQQHHPVQDSHSEAKANAYQSQTIDGTATAWDDDIPF